MTPARGGAIGTPGWSGPLILQLLSLQQQLPSWLRPAFRGGVGIFGLGAGVGGKLYALAVLVMLMLMVGVGNGVALFLQLLGVLMATGAVGGAIWGSLGALEEWGRAGSWLRWFFAILGASPTPVLFTPEGPLSLFEPAFNVVAIGIATIVATALLWIDDRRPGRPTPRRFAWLQNRERLWALADRARARRSTEVGPPVPGGD